MANPDDAVSSFQCGKGMNCAQAILMTFGQRYGLGRNESLRVAMALGGGMGRLGETCGAVTGAYMVLGLKHTLSCDNPEQKKEKTYAAVQRFSQEFKARNGSLLCKDLLGLDLLTPEGAKTMKETDIGKTKCEKYVRDSAEILQEMLKE
jgi:C_GCAxxG_C_C family probable redox protein